MKIRFRLIFGRLFAAFLLLHNGASAFAFTTKDASAAIGAYTSAFYFQNGTNGYFKDNQAGGVSYFWTQANMIEGVIDAYEISTNAAQQSIITNLLNGFISNNGAMWTYNSYNDDIMWAVLAFARGGVATGKTNYCNIAKANFDACYARAYDNTFGGGLWWNTANNFKNAAVNGPASIAAYLIYQIYGDATYLAKATNIFNWEKSTLFFANGVIADGYTSNGVTGGATTYNQGTFIGAAHLLGYTNDAALAARYTMMSMTTRGVLVEYPMGVDNSGFNAIFLRWMSRYVRDRNLQNIYQPWFQTNAEAVWNVRRTADNLSWCRWLTPTPVGTNFSSWDCLPAFEAMVVATPTRGTDALAVPGNPIGYWQLDDGSGNIATNFPGGNNGVVSNATWSASGRINGCLIFNGTTSVVQVTNPVANDFTIAFWVKTTQTGGSPNWYNGAGLVDGDYPFTANDFGTALVGNKFACGIGNADVTIQSTTAINNGAWHHCVATRQQSSGIVSVYVDGGLQATGAGNRNTLNGSSRLLFGAIASGGGFFNGSLDDIRIFGRTLSSNEVAALYNSTTIAPAAAPASLTAIAGNAQVALSWADGAGATSYNVKRALVTGGPYVTIGSVTNASFMDATASNNRSYYYVVTGTNALGESSNSTEVSANLIARTVWLQASSLTNLASGAAVMQWPDSSGNGFHGIQGFGTNRPTYIANAISGQPAVRFNSVSNAFLWFFRPMQDDFTIMCVFQSTQGLNTGTLYYQGAGLVSAEVSGVVNDFGTCLFANGSLGAGTGNPDVGAISGSGYNNGAPHILTFKRTKSTGSVALYVDSLLLASATGSTASLTAPNFLTLGGQAVLNNFLTGDIGEVQIYNSPLSDTDRLGQERALKCKFSMSGSTTPNPPTGLTTVVGNRRISLNWLLSPGAASYNVWRSTNAGASYQLAATALTTSSFVDANAANGQTNFYKVTASSACGAGADSSVVNILLPLPALSMSVNANTLGLSWPNWASDWGLYVATNLMPPVTWSPVTNSVINTNGTFNIALPIGPGSQFYRLASP